MNRDGGGSLGARTAQGSAERPANSSDLAEVWRPAAKARLSETVGERIRQAILAGDLKPGDRLHEGEIAERLQVSKSPVREAIRDLQREGLVSSHPRQGSFVRVLTSRDIHDISEVRQLLESFAIESAMRTPNPEWIRQLEDAVDRMRRAEDRATLNDEHLRFHDVILSRTGNRQIVEILRGLRTQVETFMAFVDLLYRGPEAVANDHQDLVDAIASNDVLRTQQTIDEHIRVAGEWLASTWDSDIVPSAGRPIGMGSKVEGNG